MEGQGEEKGRSFALLALGPDRAAVALHDAMHNGQSHAFALSVLRVKALKYLKEAVHARFRNAQAVVAHPVLDLTAFLPAANLHFEWTLRTSILEAVPDQIGKNLSQRG